MNDSAAPDRRSRDPTAGPVMARPFGIPLHVSPTWFIAAVLIVVVFAPTVADRLPGIGVWRYVVAFAFAVLLYLSVLVHELSHSVVALGFGLPVRRITLYLLGGVSEIERDPQTPLREFLVAFAGPLLSLLLALASFALYRVLPAPSVASLLALQLALANGLVGVFNLLPGLPLDGGRVLRAGLWQITGRPGTATLTAAWAGRVLGVLVFATPFLLAAAGAVRLDIVFVIWAALVGSFIWTGAGQSLRAARMRGRLPRLDARELARRSSVVRADLPLAEALRELPDGHVAGLVVVDPAGRPVALVDESAVSAVPPQRRPWVTVGTMARTLEPDHILSADLTGTELLAAMQAAPSSRYLLVERSGEVYGTLAAGDVQRAYAA